MCRFFGLRATRPCRVEDDLVHAPNALMAQSRRDVDGFEHADGWGIAAWQDGALEPRFQKRSQAAHQSEEFRAAASRVHATAALAHVRRATVGAVVDVNTHPFTHGRFAFVHNGTVPYFERIRDDMRDAMGPDHRAAIQGTTDSEHLFHLILSEHGRAPARPLFDVVKDTLGRIIAWCRREGLEPHLGLNVLLSDGERLVGSRWRRSLAWLERDGPRGHRALVIASEPTTTGEPWQDVPERSVFEATPDLGLRVEPLHAA